jgi:2',3'-cyclic-nucleotide 2'-phosphodiesterase (5'-nucleotidase family)
MLLGALSLPTSTVHAQAAKQKTSHKTQKINLIYSNDLEGTVDTCGCGVDPGGGVVRRYNWYKSNKFSTSNALYLNVGNTLFTSSGYMDYELKYMNYGAETLAHSMKLMNISAYTPGEEDFKLGLDTFIKITKNLPVLITNSTHNEFKKEISLTLAGQKIAIIGLVEPALFGDDLSKELKLTDPIKELKSAIKKLKKDHDLIICNVYTEQKLLDSLSKIKGVDIFVSSRINEELAKPQLVNNAIILRVFKGGDSIGLLSYENKKNAKKIDVANNNYITAKLAQIEIMTNSMTDKEVIKKLEEEKKSLEKMKVKVTDKDSKFENLIDYLGGAYASKNELSARLKKYEALQRSATPQLNL